VNNTFRELLENISRLNLDIRQHIRITEHNINRIFSQFISRGILNNNNLTSDLKVSIFIGSITDRDHYYLHPTRRNRLIIPNNPDGIGVDAEKYRAFFNYFQGENYSIEERRVFTQIQDRLLDELQRRRTGDFFTPTIWADEAIKMISEVFGENWKEEYIVWDCASGTKNLTRDYIYQLCIKQN
jgi:hypothetical protein